jgi:transmembrane sensor
MEIDFRVIKRYWEEKESEGDKDQIIDWFSDIKFESDINKKYRLLWEEMADDTGIGECDGSVILGRIYHMMKNDEYKNLPQKRGMVPILNLITKVAAILFIPLLVYLLVITGTEASSPVKASYSQIHSPVGNRTKFFLPDGSTGWLNAGSHLEFPAEFKGKSREVRLVGEAYFDVISNSKKPFIVSGENHSVIAYGTSFNVNAYPEDPSVEITLVSGNIGIYRRQNGKLLNLANLKPGQMFVCYPGTGLNRIENVDANKVAAWKDGMLAFRDESLTEVVRRINRWYNVEIIIMNEDLRSYSYQATFMDETLDEILKLLQRSAPLEFKDLGREKRPDGTFEKRQIELYYKPS